MAASTLTFASRIAPGVRPAERARVAEEIHARKVRPTVGAGLDIEGQLTRAFARSYLRTWPASLLLAFALFGAATLWVPVGALLPGFVVIAAAVGVTAVACRQCLEGTSPSFPIRMWRRGFVASEAVHGSGWVLFALPFFAADREVQDFNAHSFVLVTCLVVMVATALLRARIFAAVIASLVPLGLAVLLAAVHAKDPESGILVLLTFGAQLFLAYFTWRLHRATQTALRSRAEMRASLAALAEAKATSSEAERRAEAADRAKQLFLATMSHELRTPLNAILGFSEVMKNEVLGSHSTPSYREYSSDIHGSGQHLLGLINEILDLTRIQAGQYELNRETLHLGPLIADSVARVAESGEAKQLRITAVVDETLAPISADDRAVRQILGNLVSNAVKFTPPGGSIAIKAGWTSRGGQYVSVQDDGPGIPANEIPMVMSSFGRGSLAVSTAAPGVGLGLPIVKGLAELHGGRFTLRSRPGSGTEATVIFPAGRVLGLPDRSGSAEPARPEAA